MCIRHPILVIGGLLLRSPREVAKTQRDKQLALPGFPRAGTTHSLHQASRSWINIVKLQRHTAPVIDPLSFLLLPSLVSGFLARVN